MKLGHINLTEANWGEAGIERGIRSIAIVCMAKHDLFGVDTVISATHTQRGVPVNYLGSAQ